MVSSKSKSSKRSSSRSSSVSTTPSVRRARANIAQAPTQPCSDVTGALNLMNYSHDAWKQVADDDSVVTAAQSLLELSREPRVHNSREKTAALGLVNLGRSDRLDREKTASWIPELNGGVQDRERTQSCSPERNTGFATPASACTTLEQSSRPVSVASVQTPQNFTRPAVNASQLDWTGLLEGPQHPFQNASRSAVQDRQPTSMGFVPGTQHLTRPVVQRVQLPEPRPSIEVRNLTTEQRDWMRAGRPEATWYELEAMRRDAVYPSHPQCDVRDLSKAHLEYLATIYPSLKPGFVLKYPKPTKKKVWRNESKMVYPKSDPKPVRALVPANNSRAADVPVYVRKTKSSKKSMTTAGCAIRPIVGAVENVQADTVPVIDAQENAQTGPQQPSQEKIQQNPAPECQQSSRPEQSQQILRIRCVRRPQPESQKKLQPMPAHSPTEASFEGARDGEKEGSGSALAATSSDDPKLTEPTVKPTPKSPTLPNAEPSSSPFTGSGSSRCGRTRKRTQRAIEGEENGKELTKVLKKARK